MLIGIGAAAAQEEIGLAECRRRALDANLGLKRAEAKQEQTAALQKVALWQMLPKVSVNGGYLWMDKSVNLINDEQRNRLTHIGDNATDDISAALHGKLDGIPLFGTQIANSIDNVLGGSSLPGYFNNVGTAIAEGLETDTRNMWGGAAMLTQPIYLGGKLLAAYRTSRLLHQLSGIQLDKEREATLIAVDEAYWQVVSVKHKKELAERYAALLDTLEHNVQLAVAADMATVGDLAKVRVKRSEAQMSLTKATNGLILAKMLLAQRCGMELDAEFEVADVELAGIMETDSTADVDMEEVLEQRAEMKMLRVSDSVAQQGVRMAASSLKPNIVATGGYLVSNPNVFDGFSTAWGGTWMAGVVVNVPIVHVGGVYAVKAAKAKRREVQYQMAEAEEMITLQVKKLQSELELAYRKLDQSRSGLESAEENLRLATESYAEGMCSSSDLMAAQTAWLQAESEVVDARIEIAMSRVYLKQALGM
ncbi:MAG: TolC family protein [Bacteroidales bacterium]|nr:TolC family protein [Bacteroidales bacterium]